MSADNPNESVPPAQAWILAIRPKTLTAAIAPVFAGSAVAIGEGAFALGPAFAALFAAIMIQIATNLYNDVVDFERGTDSNDRLGPMRVTQAGLLTPTQVRTGVVFTLVAATLAGVYLLFEAGWPVLLIGIGSILAGLAYTGGPFPLVRYGLGDIFTMVFFGFIAVAGTVFVQANNIPPLTWLVATALGSTITALLVVNNIRDISTDTRAGRRTLPVVWGKAAGLMEYILLLGAAYVAPAVASFLGYAPIWINLTLLSLPLSIWLVDFINNNEGRKLNIALARTGQLVLLHAILLSIGIIVA
jgi:1,4-dihydroxy-2-naphthoate octaprenyltransferase